MPRHHLLLPFLAALGLASCGDDSSSTIVVALSSEAPMPEGVESISIRVSRGGVSYHNETYYVADKDNPTAGDKKRLTVADIPGTLTIVNDDRASGPVSVSVEATLVAAQQVQRKTLRSATMSFVKDKQKLLRMPIQLACSDVSCPSGKTCRAGQCLDEAVNEQDLEDFDDEKVRPVEGKCFQRETCEAQGGNELRIPIDTVISVLQEDCTVPYIFPQLASSDADLDGITDPKNPKLAKLRSSVNMGYLWSGAYNIENDGKDISAATWTVVDQDPVEGWNYADVSAAASNPDATRRVILSPGLCAALKADREVILAAKKTAEETGQPYVPPATRLLGTVELRGCTPKPRGLPECNPGQQGLVASP